MQEKTRTQLGAINNHSSTPKSLQLISSCFTCSTTNQLTSDPYFVTDSIKSLLGRHTKILVKYMVKLELKADKYENRVLVSTKVV